ncbi:hypothetical protein LshimejAT787_2100880 [Lyophyllum shimeji]|uniref:Uncharacterized protein n=1 Tax=Lyophyllum shimeji TaxID=47721 RepID=A0A9P3Q0E3_LYOSH|nr:hypothetical protein LshimejAT787_2100880 [Lyophyllum shimeji]
MSRNLHWSWQYFFTDEKKPYRYRNNCSNKNAWCIACLDRHCTLTRESDVITAALDLGQARTPEEMEAQARLDSPPMASKPPRDPTHASTMS